MDCGRCSQHNNTCTVASTAVSRKRIMHAAATEAGSAEDRPPSDADPLGVKKAGVVGRKCKRKLKKTLFLLPAGYLLPELCEVSYHRLACIIFTGYLVQ